MTQNNQILQHLKKGKRLTSMGALRRFGCMRLPSRVYDLKKSGHDIQRRMVDLPNGKRVAEYRLNK